MKQLRLDRIDLLYGTVLGVLLLVTAAAYGVLAVVA
jgi:hypothetical protein